MSCQSPQCLCQTWIGDTPGGLFQQSRTFRCQYEVSRRRRRGLFLRCDTHLDSADLATALPHPVPNQLRFLKTQTRGPGRTVDDQAQAAVADAGKMAVIRQFLGQAGPDLTLKARQSARLDGQPGGVGFANLLKNFGYRS